MANMMRPYHPISHLLRWVMSFKQAFRRKIAKRDLTGYFRVAPSLCFKARLGAKLLIWTMCFILLHIKLIFTRKVLHLVSFWKWETLELGKRETLVFCGSPPPDLWLSQFLKGKLARGLAKGTTKRATKTCTWTCFATLLQNELRCTTLHVLPPTFKLVLQQRKSGCCRWRKVVTKRRG